MSVGLVLPSSIGATPSEPLDGRFTDDDGSPHEGAIEAVAEAGITVGCDPDAPALFCPAAPVTRGQMATFLHRALDLAPGSIDRFTDDDGSVHESAIDALAGAGITQGCDIANADHFCPDDSVTRGQMAAFLVRALGYTDDGGGDRFVDDDGSTFEADIDRLAVAGVTQGCNPPTNDRFCPADLVTRGQMATFLARALDLDIPDVVPPVDGEVVSGVVHRLTWDAPFPLGLVSESDIEAFGPFEYATKGFDNGYEDRRLLEVVENESGLPVGRWARAINPGGLDAHTFSKAIRAVNQDGTIITDGHEELWVRFELFIDDGWATQDQGKLGYSWTNADGAPAPGSNPTADFEFLFHYFSPNHQKTSALWPTSSWPDAVYGVGDMVIGLDVYAADERITTTFSEPVFFVEEVGVSDRQKLFVPDTHYVMWVHLVLNTPSTAGPYDGVLEGWWSEDGGATYRKGVDIDDMNWRGASTTEFQDMGLVRFHGGSGVGFEPGGAPDKNTDTVLPVQDYWYYLGELRTQTANPYPGGFD